MSRIARVVATGLPHHITQRGNYQQDIFINADDRMKYLSWINEYSVKYGFSIFAYCLMQNHVHFIGVPLNKDSLAKVFNTAHMRYSQYFNKKLTQRGHLWQGRFYSCVLDEPHLLLAARYVERNPVRAGLAKQPWQWPWSSAMFHVGAKEREFINLGGFLGKIGMSFGAWKKYIGSSESGISLNDIRKHTLTGHPLGVAAFIETLERKLDRRLLMLPIGRPKVDKKIVAVPI